MKKLSTSVSILLIILLVNTCSASPVQEDDAGRVKPPTGGASSGSSKGGGKTKSSKSSASRRPKSSPAELTIHTNPTVSTVLIENQTKGNTDTNGSLTIRGLKAGSYTVTIRKLNFQEETRVVEVVAGKKRTEEFVLVPERGILNVSSTVPGVTIEVSNSGTYDRVEGLLLPPAHYRVTISKLGYRTFTQDIEIRSAQTFNLPVTVVSLPLEELLTQAQERFDRQSYGEAIALSRAILSSYPNHAKAYRIVGLSFYFAGNYAESISAVARAVKLGESVSIPVSHRHGGAWAGKTLCSGNLTLHQTTFEFISADYIEDNFRVSYSKIYEMGLRDEIRLFTKIGKLKPNGKEEKREYSFYSPDAIAQGKMIYCSLCLPKMQVILQILRQVRGQP